MIYRDPGGAFHTRILANAPIRLKKLFLTPLFAYHSQLYHEYRDAHGLPVPDDAWTGQQREMECIAHQLSIMRQIGAPQHEVDYLMSSDGAHNDTNQDGLYTWEDYHLRDW